MGQVQAKYRNPIRVKDLKAGTCFSQGSARHHDNMQIYTPCKKLKKKSWSRRKNGSRLYAIEYEDGGGIIGFNGEELVGKCKCPSKKTRRSKQGWDRALEDSAGMPMKNGLKQKIWKLALAIEWGTTQTAWIITGEC